jgi:PAS domain S-box-containing protein
MVRLEVESEQGMNERRSAEDRFYKAFNANPGPIAITTIPDECYLDVNESFLQVTGFERREVIGRTASELNFWTHPEERAHLIEELSEHKHVRDLEIGFNTKSGEKRTGLESAEIIDVGGQVCMLAILKDITELKVAQEKLLHNAFHDSLTNLPNRALVPGPPGENGDARQAAQGFPVRRAVHRYRPLQNRERQPGASRGRRINRPIFQAYSALLAPRGRDFQAGGLGSPRA